MIDDDDELKKDLIHCINAVNASTVRACVKKLAQILEACPEDVKEVRQT